MKDRVFLAFIVLSACVLFMYSLHHYLFIQHYRADITIYKNDTKITNPFNLINKVTKSYQTIWPNDSYVIKIAKSIEDTDKFYYILYNGFDVDSVSTNGILRENDKFVLLENNFIEYQAVKTGDEVIHITVPKSDAKQYIQDIQFFDTDQMRDFISLHSIQMAIYFTTIGVLLVTAIYALFLWYIVRESLYFVFAILEIIVIFYLMYNANLDIFIFGERFSDQFYKTLVGIMTIFGVLFAKIFLNSQEKSYYVDIILYCLIVFIAIATVFMIIIQVESFMLIVVALFVILSVSILRFMQGFRMAIFLIIGVTLFTILGLIGEYGYFDSLIVYLGFVISPIVALLMLVVINIYIKDMLNQREQSKRILEQKSRLSALGETVLTIAHQWRNPLSALSFLLANIKEEAQKIGSQKIVDKTIKGDGYIFHLSQTLDAFLNFYKMPKQKEFVNLSEEMEIVIDFIKNSFFGIEIDVQMQSEESQVVWINKMALRHIILNLVQNSIDAFKRKSFNQDNFIRLVVKNRSIEVIDNAGGVDESMRSKLFSLYESDKPQGVGVGLAMSKQIAHDQLGATLKYKPLDGGTSFLLEWK